MRGHIYVLYPCICLAEHKITACALLQLLFGTFIHFIYEVWEVQITFIWRCKNVSCFPIIILLKLKYWKKISHFWMTVYSAVERKGFAVGSSHSYSWLSNYLLCVVVVQSLSCVWLFATPGTAAHQAFLSITNSWSLLKLISNKSMVPSNHLILCHPLLLLPSIFPSIRVFPNESALCIRWPKYWSFCFSISPSNEYSGLISFRIDWFNLLAVQESLKSLLQHHNSKASVLWHSAFFMVQLLHPFMTTGKTIALTMWIFGSKVISLLCFLICCLGLS